MDIWLIALIFTPVLFGMLLVLAVSPGRAAYQPDTLGALVSLLLMVAPVLFYGLFLVGLRPESAGNDTARYVLAYRNLDGLPTALGTGIAYFGSTELLWWPLQSLVKPFLSVRGWLVGNYLMVFIATYAYYRVQAKAVRLSAVIFVLVFLTFYLVYTGNIMRQALAIPVGALGFCLFGQRRYAVAAILVVLSIGLHWSAVALLAVPLLQLPPFRKNYIYVAVPLMAAIFSPFSSEIVGWVVNLVGLPELSSKFDLYFGGGRQSHLTEVWKTANFWICSLSSFAFLLFCKPSEYEDRSLHRYVLLFLTLILLGVRNADFSERYLPFILLVLPLMIGALVDRARLPSTVKATAFFGFFFVLSVLVFSAASSQYTLGYTF